MASKTIGRKGFAQVEPNHLSGIVTSQIYAQLPVAAAMGDYIENGRFAKYDYAEGEVNLAGAGEWMLIYNEEKKYDERLQNHKDYVMKKTDFIDGVMVPRLIKTNVGDIFTTNAFGITTGKNSSLDAAENDVAGLTIADTTSLPTLAVDKTTGYLVISTSGNADANGPMFEIAKIYTLADGQDALKLVRVK